MIRLFAWSVKKMLPAASAVGPSLNAIVVATWTSETSWPMSAVNENNKNTLNANEVLTRFSLTVILIMQILHFIFREHFLSLSGGKNDPRSNTKFTKKSLVLLSVI